MNSSHKFNTRAFVVMGMAVSFLGLPFSGYINHLLAFEQMSVDRHVWMSAHNALGVLFTVFAVWHSVLNIKLLSGYVKRAGDIIFSREAAYAAAAVLAILLLFVLHAVHLNRSPAF